ncbi:ABC transporter substrate-binding protein [Spirulina sp. CCNP1310]|uniref:ABC transporter substrate-binding protein n=1 Tax=Spirulina sp. CCNP1310 TaxID=3110249 RepID=UPI002B1F04A4|nr:ABC transporter substrate-binding protein [Spirulina sp. CCNP1310]MEA5421508.1 ABC transporter substrate-binding protein [Spirulina sp. CCNP1310]
MARLARQFWQRFTLALITLVIIVGCRAASPPTIAIGAIVPLTGDVAQTSGIPTVEGIQLAIDQVNANGGILLDDIPHQITLITADDQDDPNRAVAEANRLINQENIVALVGVPLSRMAIPVADVAEHAKVPMISSKSTNPATTQDKAYIFRATFTDTFQGQVLATLAAQELGLKRAAVLFDVASNYNQYLANLFQEEFEARGGEIVAFESYLTGATDFSEQLAIIAAAEPEVLFLPNYPAEVLIQAQQARALGIEAVLIGGDAWSGFKDVSDPSLAGALYTTDWALDLNTPASEAFIEAYRAAYDASPTSAAALGYDAAQLILKAIASTGSTDAQGIRQYLANDLEYNGVTGKIEFANSGDPIKGAVVVRIEGGDRRFDRLVTP